MTEFMLRALMVGGLATLAAFVFEQALLHARMPTRYAWTSALLLTTALPFVPRLSDRPVSEALPVVAMPAVVLTAAREVEAGLPVNVLLIAWVFLSALVLIAVLRAYLRLHQIQKHWRSARIDGVDVSVSDGFGPAVFGFMRPRIVVPEWVGAASVQEQHLVVLHEREHIRAGDQYQLFLSIVAYVIMPWNPFLWLQSRRLGFRVETDCDARVLAVVPDAHRYATLLVNVGARQTGWLLTPALAEERNGLERRIRTMGTKFVQNRWKAASFMMISSALTMLACESRMPHEVKPQRVVSPELSERSLPRKQQEPRLTIDGKNVVLTADAVIATKKYYPPVLRDAGIRGSTTVRANLDGNGKIVGYEVIKGSGHEALDQAALKAVRESTVLVPSMKTDVKPTAYDILVVFDPKIGERAMINVGSKSPRNLLPTKRR